MDSHYVSRLGVRDQDRNAIGHAHADSRGKSRRATYDCVGLDVGAGLARVDGAAAMNLFHLDHARHAERPGDRVVFRASFGEPVPEPRLFEQCRSQDHHQRP